MNRDELVRHWSTFCSISDMFELTQKYVYQGIQEDKETGKMFLIHGNVYSEMFREILVLACTEFESIGKKICMHLEPSKNIENIIDITEAMLTHFPQINRIPVETLYWTCIPLSDWKLKKTDKTQIIEGIDWWKAYNSIKHDKEDAFRKATLENALGALSSLYVLNLYAMRVVDGNFNLIKVYPPKYIIHNLSIYGDELPDFIGKTIK